MAKTLAHPCHPHTLRKSSGSTAYIPAQVDPAVCPILKFSLFLTLGHLPLPIQNQDEHLKDWPTNSPYLIWNQPTLGKNIIKIKLLLNSGNLNSHIVYIKNGQSLYAQVLLKRHKQYEGQNNTSSLFNPSVLDKWSSTRITLMQPNTHNLKHNYKFYQRIQEVKKIYEELNKLKRSNNKHLSDTQENIRIRLMKWWKEFRFWKLKANWRWNWKF